MHSKYFEFRRSWHYFALSILTLYMVNRGGSFQVNNWEYVPDYALAERILKRNYELCPALAGPNGKSWRDSKSNIDIILFLKRRHTHLFYWARSNFSLCRFLKTVEIVAHNVGFRPSREGGARLDLEDIEIGGGNKAQGMELAPKSDILKPRKAAVLHAYGIGESWIRSWRDQICIVITCLMQEVSKTEILTFAWIFFSIFIRTCWISSFFRICNWSWWYDRCTLQEIKQEFETLMRKQVTTNQKADTS